MAEPSCSWVVRSARSVRAQNRGASEREKKQGGAGAGWSDISPSTGLIGVGECSRNPLAVPCDDLVGGRGFLNLCSYLCCRRSRSWLGGRVDARARGPGRLTQRPRPSSAAPNSPEQHPSVQPRKSALERASEFTINCMHCSAEYEKGIYFQLQITLEKSVRQQCNLCMYKHRHHQASRFSDHSISSIFANCNPL
jgi:hypothetical protein